MAPPKQTVGMAPHPHPWLVGPSWVVYMFVVHCSLVTG